MMIFLAILIITANIWLYVANVRDGDVLFAIISALGIVCGLITLTLEVLKYLVKKSKMNRGE